jgi:hypothetical protein
MAAWQASCGWQHGRLWSRNSLRAVTAAWWPMRLMKAQWPCRSFRIVPIRVIGLTGCHVVSACRTITTESYFVVIPSMIVGNTEVGAPAQITRGF